MQSSAIPRRTHPWGSFHRIIEWPGLKRTSKLISFQPLCYARGCQPLDQLPRATASLALNTSRMVPLVVASIPSPDVLPFLQAVKRFLKLECKCHGVSGSCTLRTCWLAMSDFRKTGDYLRKKYNGAIQVIMNQDGTGFTVANKNFRKPTKTDLVYFENSPDYCVMDKSAGTAKSSHKHLQQLSLPLPMACSPQGCSVAQPYWGAALCLLEHPWGQDALWVGKEPPAALVQGDHGFLNGGQALRAAWRLLLLHGSPATKQSEHTHSSLLTALTL